MSLIFLFLIISDIIKLKEPEFKIEEAGIFFYIELKNGNISFSSPGEPDIPWEFLYIPLKDNEYAEAHLKIISKKEIKHEKPLIPFPYEDENIPFLRYEMNIESYKKYPDENLKNFGVGSKRGEKCLVLAYTPFIIENGKIYLIDNAEIILNKRVKKRIFENKSHLEFFKRPFWIKIKTKDEGIYRITYRDLKEIGIEPSLYSYENFIIFSLFGERLNPSRDSLELLNPLPYTVPFIFKDKDDDGFFTINDTILFYSPSIKKRKWDGNYFSFEENPFTDTTIFYLALDGGGGKLMKEIDVSPIYYEKIRNRAISYERYEKNIINLGKRGLRWVGEDLSKMSLEYKKHSFDVFLKDIASIKGKLKICIVVMRGNPNNVYIGYLLNKDTVAYTPYSPPSLNTSFTSIFSVNNLEENNNFEIIVGNENDFYDYLHLDYFEIEYEKFLKGEEIHAYDTTKGKVLYKIESDKKGYLIEVTDYKDPKLLKGFYFAKDTIKFVLENEDVREFYFSKKPKKPLKISIVESLCELRDTLNKADYIIITHKNFENVLKNYIEYRKNNLYFGDSLIKNPKIKIVTTQKIYEEFGFGSPDFVAIRNFLAYTFYFWEKKPLYVLLAGNGNYDFKYNIGSNKNFVPSTEWGEVLDEFFSGFYSYDLFYVQFDPPQYDPPDMMIGRIPAENVYELDNYLKRVMEYEKEKNNSLWRNRIIGVADDHLLNGIQFIKEVRGTLRFLPKNVDFKEIYTSFFPYVEGARPLAKVKLFEELNKGCFLTFFYGHGSEWQIFNQKIIYVPSDLNNLNFGEKRPIFFFGTCKPSYFNKTERCVGEALMIHPNSGISTLGSSTLIGIGTYKIVLESFLNVLFDYKIHTLGECYFLSNVPRYYILLGDPTLVLQIPPPLINLKYQSKTIDTVQKGEFFEFEDTLNLDGEILINLFGRPKIKVYPEFLPQVKCTTYERSDDIFRGIFEIKNGVYHPKIPLPFSLSKEDTFGKLIVYYGKKGRGIVGIIDSIYFKDFDGSKIDTTKPKIKLYYLGKEIKDSLRIRKNDEIEIEIFDENGILIYGNERIKLKLAPEEYDLTDYYICENDDPRKGRIKFKIPENITSGYKNLTVYAYDNYYNLGIETKIVYVEEKEKIFIRCLPFPNPSPGRIYFGIETNENGKIGIKIYTLRGRLIYEKNGIYINKGFNKIEWNGKDRDGHSVSNGIYIYKIEFENKEKNYKKNIKGKIAIVK